TRRPREYSEIGFSLCRYRPAGAHRLPQRPECRRGGVRDRAPDPQRARRAGGSGDRGARQRDRGHDMTKPPVRKPRASLVTSLADVPRMAVPTPDNIREKKDVDLNFKVPEDFKREFKVS